MPIETCEEDEDFGRDCDTGERDEMDEEGCLFPGECCMPGPHVKGECHTPDMIEDSANAESEARHG